MNLTRDRLRSIGWAAMLTVCLALTVALGLRVNAVKGSVHAKEREIVSLKQEIRFLETEFQTRANQHQLRALNEIEFGYRAPEAAQYIETERQLAVLGKPRPAGAPDPIRLAAARPVEDKGEGLIAMVSPLTGLAAEPAEERRPADRKTLAAREAAAPTAARVTQPQRSQLRADDPVASAIAASEDIGDRLARIDPAGGGGE